MKRIAIIGGGIAGVSAAYALARQQTAGAPITFKLFEATDHLGGIVETERRDGFIIECGPDSWVTEKRWARELAIELGLESEIITSQDKQRKTYLAENGTLQPMPDGMRMMVPVEWESVLQSPLFSQQAKIEYQSEPQRAEQLKATALDAATPPRDESVRDFIVRHFGAEVADTIAAPLLAGILGGNIANLSTRAVLPAYVALEREHGSLILGLQQKQKSGSPGEAVFTTLQNGVAGLIKGMESHLCASDVQYGMAAETLERTENGWIVRTATSKSYGNEATEPDEAAEQFDAILLATPAKETAKLLAPLNPGIPFLLPQHSSSAIVVALAFSPDQAACLKIPRGFGFLVPQRKADPVTPGDSSSKNLAELAQSALLACTFVDQKFPYRAPPGAVLLRAFFGGDAAPALLKEDDATLAMLARKSLENILGKLP
ncbi:MAG: protoporphyrinogen oxidase, partial [Acidobacteriaceae bacterium]